MTKGLHWIDLGQWPPLLAVTADRRAFNRWMKARQGEGHHPFPLLGGGHSQLMEKDSGGHGILMMAVHLSGNQIEDICTIAHEAVHIARFLFGYVNEEEPSKEAEAYLIEHVVRQALICLGLCPK